MLRADSVRRSAITRRRPMIFTSSVPLRGSRVALARAFMEGCAPRAAPEANAESMSPGSMRPAGPVPVTVDRSRPASAARRRDAGEAMTREALPPPFAAGAGALAALAAAGCCDAIFGVIGTSGDGGGAFAAGASPDAAEVASVSNTTSSDPTATMSPGWPLMETMRPVTGAGISTAAFSVITSHMTWSSCTRSPGFTCHATTSAETVPSPRSGILNT